MKDMSTMSLSAQKKDYASMFDARESLEYLKQSEVVRLVLAEKYTPQDIDNAFRNLRKRVQELEHTHILDAENVKAYRKQIELLMGVSS